MLTHYGLPLLRWLDEKVMPEAEAALGSFWNYIESWREVLENG